MKNLIYTLLMLVLPAMSFADNSDFSYDKQALSDEFSQLDEVSAVIDESDVSYEELTNDPLFKGNVELTNHIAVRPNFEFDNMDWGAFAWGLCCWPVGLFVVVLNDDKDQDSKISYLIGVVTSVVLWGGSWFFVGFGYR